MRKRIQFGAVVLLLVAGLLLFPVVVMAQHDLHYERANLPLTGGALSGNLELRNPDSLAAESLGQPVDFSAGWTTDGAICVSNAGSIKCTGPGTGTFTQTSANAAANGGIAWAWSGINGWFVYAPTISNVAGTPACTVTTAFAAAATAIPNASASTQVQAKSTTVGDFVTSCVLGAGATIWFDTLSLKQVNGGTLTVPRILAGSGTTALPGLSFVAMPSSGFTPYVSAGNSLDLSLGGVLRVRFSDTLLSPVTTDSLDLGYPSILWKSLYLARSTQGAKSKSLTDAAAATPVIRVPVATSGYQAGEVIWNAQSTDATDFRTTAGRIRFAGVNKAGTLTCTVNVIGTDLTASSNANTLVCAWTNVVNTTNCDLSVTCTDNTAGSQTMTVNARANMPTTATLTFVP